MVENRFKLHYPHNAGESTKMRVDHIEGMMQKVNVRPFLRLSDFYYVLFA